MLRVFRIPESKSNPCAVLPTRLQRCSQHAELCASHPQNRSPRFKSSPHFPQGQANISHHHWSESTTNLFSSPNNMASNFNTRHQRGCGGNFFLAHCRTRRVSAAGKHSSSSMHRAWESPAGQHSAPPQMGRALIVSWQEAILLLPEFLSACSNIDFGKKNAAWHIIFSQAAARNQRCDNGIPMKSQPIWTCWFAQGEGTQARLFPVLPTWSGTPFDQPTVEKVQPAPPQGREDFSPAPSFDLSACISLLSIAKVFTSSVLLPRVLSQDPLWKSKTKGRLFCRDDLPHSLFHLFLSFMVIWPIWTSLYCHLKTLSDWTNNWCSQTPGWRNQGTEIPPPDIKSRPISRVSNSEDDSVSAQSPFLSNKFDNPSRRSNAKKHCEGWPRRDKDQQQHLTPFEEQATVKSCFQGHRQMITTHKTEQSTKTPMVFAAGNSTTYLKHK